MNNEESFESGEDPEMLNSRFPGLIHSCSFCSVQELDPSVELKREVNDDLFSGTLIRYRGPRIRDGALQGCAFFKDAFDSLQSILETHEHEQTSDSPRFRPENWIYELYFIDYTDRLETARGTWKCAMGELAGDVRHPKQKEPYYFVLAHQGTGLKEYVIA